VDAIRRNLGKAGADYLRKRAAAEVARKGLVFAIVCAQGELSEAEIARIAGVQRETVRKALGK
jgi:hypothetical protein